METDTLEMPRLARPFDAKSLAKLRDRFRESIAGVAWEWSDRVTALARWEDSQLLEGGKPNPKALAEHKFIVDQMLAFGKILEAVTAKPECADARIAEMVSSGQRLLEWKLEMWHDPNPMRKEEADAILRAIFNEP